MEITIAHIFYGQHDMLPLHKEAWNCHPAESVRYTLIDDCSPKCVSRNFQCHNLDIYRILKDIPWNISGARNLAFQVATTPWVLCADVDHVISALALRGITDLDLTDENVVYAFARKNSNGYLGVRTTINILMSKKRYFEIGGHDEDFAGHYGREETFFYKCLVKHGVRVVFREDIVLDWHPKVGATGEGLVRDKSFNGKIFERKLCELQKGRYVNGPILRFPWKKL